MIDEQQYEMFRNGLEQEDVNYLEFLEMKEERRRHWDRNKLAVGVIS
ncbi:hypothetical protein HYV86_03105 [Candidatus Woesearchaeota archaeon]|nr:hypothetical protein [Candidatus Woesearchaeota archaeon]